MEEHFFFNNNGRKLFGFLHMPERTGKTALVFCSPFIEEKVRTQRIYVNFARLLASEGYPVMRFDYMGYGDSEGAFEDATIDSMVNDTLKAVSFCQQKTGKDMICLFGGRLGGTVAAIASQKNDLVKGLLLWDPIMNGYSYIYKCLRTNLTMQTLRHNKIIYKRDKLIEMILDGDLVNIDGYLIGKGLYQSIEKVELADIAEDLAPEISVIQLAKRELPKGNDLDELCRSLTNKEKRVTFSEVKEVFSWESQRFYNPKPEMLFEESTGWLKKHFS